MNNACVTNQHLGNMLINWSKGLKQNKYLVGGSQDN